MNAELRAQAIETIKNEARTSSKKNKERIDFLRKMMMRNKAGIYKNTDEDKEKIFKELYSKIDNIKNVEEVSYKTGRHLIYFTIFLSEDFIRLLDFCLNSILKNTANINFDLLFITDEAFKAKILALDVCKNFNCHFHVINPPLTGVWASAKKLIVHDFPLINNYEKILYLDCDILCVKDISIILNRAFFPEILYTATNTKITTSGLCTPSHSLMYLTQKDAEFIYDNTHIALPFNAGQFLFLNTKRMQLHFDNVRWLFRVWPDMFFFEQSFMNHYFVLNGLTKFLEDDLLNPLVSISSMKQKADPKVVTSISTKKILKVYGATSSSFSDDVPKILSSSGSMQFIDATQASDERVVEMRHDKNSVLLHFANLSLDGEKKIKYIQDYIHANKL